MKFLALDFKSRGGGRVPKADPEHLNKGMGTHMPGKHLLAEISK